MVSAAMHTAAIALAVVATAQARVDAPTAVQVVRWISPPRASAPAARAAPAERPALAALPELRLLERIDLITPSVDVLPRTAGLNPVGPMVADTSSRVPPGLAGVATTDPLMADQVDRQVHLVAGGPAPRYPNALRVAGVEGQVVAVFVVNERGRVELGSLRFTSSDNALFEAAVRDALAALRFVPAEVGGRKVRQLVQMPFVFRLSR